MLRQVTLRDTLINQINNYYLLEDNKDPQGFMENLATGFGLFGYFGRSKANEYLVKVVKNISLNDSNLAARVFKDTNDEGNLIGERDLCYRLLQGLCQHYQIDAAIIDSKVRELYRAIYSGAGIYGGTIQRPHEFEMRVMRQLLINKIPNESQSLMPKFGTLGDNDL